MSDNEPVVDRGAMSLADLAFIETEGSTAERVGAAVWAYLWATKNTRPIFGDMIAYPSLTELREALARREQSGRE